MKDSAGEAERWLRQAEHDLELGRLALREGYFGQACVIAQQAAEKAVKAIHYHGGARVVLGDSVMQLAVCDEDFHPQQANIERHDYRGVSGGFRGHGRKMDT